MTVIADRDSWLVVLRRYFTVFAPASLAWEFAHMPLYTLWDTATPAEIIFAAVHCTGGDILIGLSGLMAALFVSAASRWPDEGYRRTALVAIALGLGYTFFSEWLNIEVREAWAYRDLMPIIPVIGTGLSPVVQWILVPTFAFWWAAPRKRGRLAV